MSHKQTNKLTNTQTSSTSSLDTTLGDLPFIHAYGPKLRVALAFPEQGLEKQSFKDECDINNIMRRYQVTGQLDHLSTRPAMWGDIPDLDFAGAMSIVVDARERFQSLPATIRDRFNNDPQQLLAFVQNPANREEAIKLGIVEPPKVAATASAAPPPVSPTGTPPATPPSAS